MATHNCHIYFIYDGQFTKIGIAGSVRKREKQLQTGTPMKLRCVHSLSGTRKDCVEAEALMHDYLGHCCARGEWFEISLFDWKDIFRANHVPDLLHWLREM